MKKRVEHAWRITLYNIIIYIQFKRRYYYTGMICMQLAELNETMICDSTII